MKISTNNQPRPIMNWDELTEYEQSEYPTILTDGSFFRYKGQVYSLEEFINVSNSGNWQGALAFTAFSGLLIRLVQNGEFVIVGYATW